uniref:Putative 28s ribosomal protein s30 mitochondrial n=1 Tax=Panstrongylus megistus TaxID=65343 RepID=A0A069DZ91_9HEMI
MASYLKLLRSINRRLSSVANNEYTKTPQYPPILNNSLKAVRKREREKRYAKYNSLHTVEEKLFALNLDKYYGWNCMTLKEHVYPYQFLPFVKFITRTYLVQDNKELFHKVQNVDIEECKQSAQNVRKYLQEAILFELKGKKRSEQNISFSKNLESEANDVIETINSVLLSSLSSQHSHLLETVVDYKPRLEAFWMVGSFHPSETVFKKRKDKGLNDDECSDPVDHWIQYFGSPVVQLRNQNPLSQLETQHLKDYNEPSNTMIVPLENSDPSLKYGILFERRHGTSIPGYWPGDENEFGLLSYHTQAYLLDRPPHFGSKEHNDSLLAQAILSSYGWLQGQASYQGFSTFTDVTYPFVTQNIITDGRQFTFSLYQLNTTVLHSENSLTNERVNICVTMPTSILYEEIRGNEFIGWNDDVVSTLLSFYIKKPKNREEGFELKPYLHPEEKYVADIEDKDRRIWLHKQFRHMYSNRPRNRLPYEIYDWERIYKVKFPTRPLDARLRPFERDCNPLEDRKYNEHMPPYVPKQFRPKKKHWTGWRSKFAKTHYPDL